jgi:hypothetical protein
VSNARFLEAMMTGGNKMGEIIALAAKDDRDSTELWAWFFEAPIQPYGGTAYDLFVTNQHEVVSAFLKNIQYDLDGAGMF